MYFFKKQNLLMSHYSAVNSIYYRDETAGLNLDMNLLNET